jgi:hypothetical protein
VGSSSNSSNGVIRVGRKGRVKFAFGEEGEPFEIDVVAAFQEWLEIDESFREQEGDDAGVIPTGKMTEYYQAALDFATKCAGEAGEAGGKPTSQAEALDFIARLREQWDELADFFQPKKREKVASPGTSGPELRFSEEPDPSPSSTN